MGEHKANRLIAALEPDNFRHLAPYLETVDLPHRHILFEHGAVVEHVYFPQTCIISLVTALQDGTSPEMTTFGPEGMVGFVPYLGDREAFGRYIV